jgi:hypothetical protein
VRFRVAGGNLAPLDAPPRRIPERFHARIDATAKMFLFRVGVRQLVGDVTLTRAPDEAGFTVRFRREPDWVLPPLVARMLRSPLRRPFQGDGAMLAFGVRDGDAGPTLAVRDYEVAVQESAIVRWLGGLGNSALSDFRQGAEREADAFEGEFWGAVRADVRALDPLAATDAVAPVQVLGREGADPRLVGVIQGESLLNDGVAFALVKVASTAVVTGSFSLLSAGGSLVLSIAGGVLIGFAVAALVVEAAVMARAS